MKEREVVQERWEMDPKKDDEEMRERYQGAREKQKRRERERKGNSS